MGLHIQQQSSFFAELADGGQRVRAVSFPDRLASVWKPGRKCDSRTEQDTLELYDTEFYTQSRRVEVIAVGCSIVVYIAVDTTRRV